MKYWFIASVERNSDPDLLPLHPHTFHLSYTQRGVVSEALWFHSVFLFVTRDRKHWVSMLSFSAICLIKPSHLEPWLNMLSISTSWFPSTSSMMVSLHFCFFIPIAGFKEIFLFEFKSVNRSVCKMLSITQRQILHCNSWHF